MKLVTFIFLGLCVVPCLADVHPANRSVPIVTPPAMGLVFDVPPTDQQFRNCRIFAEALIPYGAANPAEDAALVTALQAYSQRADQDGTAPLASFLAQYPNGRWNITVGLNLGLIYRSTGWYSKALAQWTQTWANAQAVPESDPARPLADRVLGELMELHARIGDKAFLAQILTDTKDRNITGIATEKYRWAQDGYSQMVNTPETAYRCGPMAIDQVYKVLHKVDLPESLQNYPSTDQGTNFTGLLALSQSAGMNLVAIQHAPGSPWPVPALIQWNLGHFAAITVHDSSGLYQVEDPTFGTTIWVSQQALDSEASGAALVPSKKVGNATRLTSAQADAVWGKGSVSSVYAFCTTLLDMLCCKACHLSPHGMPSASINPLLVSLNLQDSPIGYTPPVGPAFSGLIVYNQMEAGQPSTFTFANMGPKWVYTYTSYVTDNPTNLSANVTLNPMGGGQETYTGYTSTGTNTGTFAIQPLDQTTLKRTSASTFELDYPNGAKDIYGQPNGATSSPRLVFLTQRVDACGNTLTLAYDSNMRISSITDACGQVSTLTYGVTTDIYKITKVTDPFGRTATFAYTSNGHLQSITDEIGLTSSFAYGTGTATDTITSMTTPYGTSTFGYATTTLNTTDRSLVMADPLGGKAVVRFMNKNLDLPVTKVAPTVSGITFDTSALYRTSLIWDKQQYLEYGENVTYATAVQWCHMAGNTNVATNTVETIQRGTDNTIWYVYPGSTNTGTSGTSNQPIHIARVLPDGTTEDTKYTYNVLGFPTSITDPAGRVSTFVYDTNNRDLLTVKNTTSGSTDVLGSFTYNSAGQPVTETGANGQTTNLSYNSYGQCTSVTDALSDATTYTYDASSHYLTSVTGAMTGNSYAFTYDSCGRVATTTDGAGYELQYAYDNLDRLTTLTYPNGEYEQTSYTNLDPTWQRSRDGKWTYTYYDANQHPTVVMAPDYTHTYFIYCICGKLLQMIDNNGNTTQWAYDGNGRVQTKTYPDNSTVNYTYDAIGRPLTTTDAKGQVMSYTYNHDSSVNTIHCTGATSPTPDVSYTYSSQYPRVATMVDGTGTTTYNYNGMSGSGAGMLSSLQVPYPVGTGSTISYTYDALNRVTGISCNGSSRSVSYDALGRITGQVDPLGTSGYTYLSNADSRIATATLPNGVTVNYAYYGNTGDKRLQEIQNQVSGTTISQFDYTYQSPGRIATWQSQLAGTNTTTSYDYSTVGRLLGAVQQDSTGTTLHQWGYTYDGVGNRLSEQIDGAANTATFNNLNQIQAQTGGGATRFSGHTDKPTLVSVNGAPAIQPTSTNWVAYPSLPMGTNTVGVVANDFDGNSTTQNYQVVTSGSAQAAPTYDANGNTTVSGTQTYSWDGYDRLAAIWYTTGATPADLAQGQTVGRKGSWTTGVVLAAIFRRTGLLHFKPHAPELIWRHRDLFPADHKLLGIAVVAEGQIPYFIAVNEIDPGRG